MPKFQASSALVAVVDDDEGICDAISSLVRSAGHRCALFSSAEAFLDSAVLGDTHCLLLDIRMPGMNGFDLQLALNGMNCGIPIIYVTATADWAFVERARHQGAVAFLTKPFDGDVLLKAIDRALDEPYPDGHP